MTALFFQLFARALVNPPLAWALLKMVWRFRHRRWFLRFPFLPLPPRDYIRWRMYTAYGDAGAVPPVEDVVRYARWAAHIG
jgi:hypothetical protein